jgi:endonuclease/exonuclease/phosphatase family metal-dependent hydrolase
MNELLNVIKDDNFIIIGDFNSKKYVLKNDFLHIDKINIPDVNGYTYKGILKNNKIVYKTIDHIVLKNILYDCAFTDEDDFKLSDHKYIGIIIYDNKL